MDHRAAPAARRRTHRRWSLVAGSVVPLALVAALAPAALARTSTVAGAPAAMTAAATTATAADGNPLAGRRWGVYKGKTDQAWAPYANATGDEKTLLGKIALRPRSTWFGAWIGQLRHPREGRQVHRQHVGRKPRGAGADGGLPDEAVGAQGLRPAADHRRADQLQAVDRPVRRGRRRAHTAIILQPDGPFALCAPGGSTAALAADRVRRAHLLARCRNTSVYIDAGASDWPQQRPGEGAEHPGRRRASAPPAASR